jgi:hypothetical protein
MKIISITILCFFLCVKIAYSADCKIRANKITEYAYQTGHVFKTSCKGCSLYLSEYKEKCSAININVETEKNKCTYKLFESAVLKNGWKYINAEYGGKNFRIDLPQKESNKIEIKVILEPPKSGSATFFLRSITLRGPSCAEWKMAF